jgi:SET domain-containing protein
MPTVGGPCKWRLDMSKSFLIKRSAIHGRGLFAARSFVPGEVVGVYEGEETSVDGRYVLWVTYEDGTELGIKGNNALRFVNHSPTPNCEFVGDELAAIEPIRPGQELTCHYGQEWV